MAYTYYQTKEREKWKITEADKKSLNRIVAEGAKRKSILSVSEPITEDTDDSKIRYQGPFYIDIDSADISEAIDSANQLLKKLVEEKVPEDSYEIYCSGKKGFHFYFHQKLFSKGRPTKNLPYIYKRMSIYFYVPGMDLQVYSGGKGNLFRIPNIQREDGLYKVRITPEELKGLTKERYVELTNAPRNIVFPDMKAPDIENSFMLNAYTSAVQLMTAEEKQMKDPGIPDSSLHRFQNKPPECVLDLSEYKVKGSVNFNKSAFQMAIYLQRSATPISLAESLMTKLSDTGSSTSYNTPQARLRHVKGLYEYARANPKRTFSCSAMRGLLISRPCENCPLHDEKQTENEIYEIEERPDGYYAVTAKTETRLTSFILTPHRMITTYNKENHQESRVYTLCSVEASHENIGTVRIEEAAWNSRSGFVASFMGMSNLKVTATDNDIQNLKHYILRDIENIDKQEIVRSAGIHRDERYGKPRYTYVEEGTSANKWGQKGTHLLELPVAAANSAMPALKNIPMPVVGDDKIEKALKSLISLNSTNIMAPVLGWIAACHLKSHVMSLRQEFPLLNLWGGRGSGKTKTSTLVCLLSGADYTIGAPPALPNTTPYAITQTLTSTTTIPRVLDEFNKGGMGQDRYFKYAEMFKQVFNGSSSMRGRIASKGERNSSGMGAIADSFSLSSPLMLLSEHATDLAALNDRMYKVMMTERSLPDHRIHMLEASRRKKQLLMFAKALTLKALEVREEWVEDRIDSWYSEIPEQYTERQALTRVVIGMGLDYFELVACKELSMNLAHKILEMKSAFLATIKDVENPDNLIGHSTEIDYLMTKLGELKALSNSSSTATPVSAAMLKVEGETLILDIPILFSTLRMHLKSSGERLPLPDANQFRMLLRNESYYIKENHIDHTMTAVRGLVVLSMPEMKSKGIDTTLFL